MILSWPKALGVVSQRLWRMTAGRRCTKTRRRWTLIPLQYFPTTVASSLTWYRLCRWLPSFFLCSFFLRSTLEASLIEFVFPTGHSVLSLFHSFEFFLFFTPWTTLSFLPLYSKDFFLFLPSFLVFWNDFFLVLFSLYWSFMIPRLFFLLCSKESFFLFVFRIIRFVVLLLFSVESTLDFETVHWFITHKHLSSYPTKLFVNM